MLCKVRGCKNGEFGDDGLCMMHGLILAEEKAVVCTCCDGLTSGPKQLACRECYPYLGSTTVRDFSVTWRKRVVHLSPEHFGLAVSDLLLSFQMLYEQDGKIPDDLAIAQMALNERNPMLAAAYARRYERKVEHLDPWLRRLRRGTDSIHPTLRKAVEPDLDAAWLLMEDNRLGSAETLLAKVEKNLGLMVKQFRGAIAAQPIAV